jgi:hypothetical protein
MTRTLSSLRRRSGTAPLAVAALFSLDALAEAQLGAIRSQVWVDGSASDQDRFGHSVSSGDFDCDGFADLAVGAPFEDADGGAPENVGSVLVLYGGAAGLTASGHQFWNQLNLADEMEAGDNFGWVLTTGDFDGDECDDLAIGIPFEAIGAESGAGAVAVVYGGPGTGLTATGNRLFWQGDGAISGVAEPLDYFG